ncbi:type II toxin-antitoxin system RelE/ParE family toxin [Robiginitomaculum antarcticum]|uniref:type II toxin-antitoxin system RelE/ParE family toxin n=1 Tax=Robiginitomaculum antarcticum TaxID=437507 RepID=UPI000382663A|nr:type II toxin-antitoxin system RelE/ParE family toxin [Robiginitomaculum antarcticum]
MKTIIWSPEAEGDFFRLVDFLSKKSPRAADRFATEVEDAVLTLKKFPDLGRHYDIQNSIRELIIPFGAKGYVMRYGLRNSIITILRIWHQRENR